MPLLRLYTTLSDDYGSSSVVRVGRTYVAIRAALEAARRASLKYGTVEVKDDAMSVHVRLLEIFRDGRPLGGRYS